MRRALREPLVHFLLLGVALFGLYAAVGRPTDGDGGEILVTEGRIRSLVETFGRQRGRAPSEDELAGMVRDFVREEALARQAIALGLDREDAIVRRHLAQKMEFLSDDAAVLPEPTEEELRSFLAARSELFRVEGRTTFSQVFLDRVKRGERLGPDAVRLLDALNGTHAPDFAMLGDARMLEAHFADVARGDIEAQFGAQFTESLEQLPLGRFEGPIESAYGAHLIRVEARTAARLPELGEVREAVAREWSASRRQEMRDARVQALLARYRVTIEDTGGAEPERLARVR